jgi:hypothetical protein
MNKLAMQGVVAVLLAPLSFAMDVVTAVHGTIARMDAAAKTIVVKTADGTEHTLHFIGKTTVHGTEAARFESFRPAALASHPPLSRQSAASPRRRFRNRSTPAPAGGTKSPPPEQPVPIAMCSQRVAPMRQDRGMSGYHEKCPNQHHHV